MLLIPKIFHRIWLGGRPMPEKFARFGESWTRHHPGWTMKLWNESNLPPLINQLQFGLSTQMAQKADILRYELISREGGVYLDTDFECVQNIEPLLDNVEAFAACEKPRVISIGIIGGIPGHSSWKTVIEKLPRSFRHSGTVSHQTGPRFVTPLLVDEPGFTRFAAKLFYPIPWGRPTEVPPPPGSYGIHHWASSWMGKAPDSPADLAAEEARAHLQAKDESLSGPGSSVAATQEVREFLSRIIAKKGIQRIVDVPCGDWNWMRLVPLHDIDYIGLDILQVLVEQNRSRHPAHRFEQHDIVRSPLPDADLLICRDFLFLRPDADVRAVLEHIKHSKARYLLATSSPALKANQDLPKGQRKGFRPVNLEIAPWLLGPPIESIRESHPACGGRSVGLWDLARIREAR